MRDMAARDRSGCRDNHALWNDNYPLRSDRVPFEIDEKLASERDPL